MKRPYLIPLAVLCCAGIAYAAGSISVTGYPAVPRTLKGGTGINIAPDGTFTATGESVATGAQPFANLSGALRGKYLPIAGTAVNAANAQAYKGNSAPSATEFSYLQGVTSAIQGQLDGKAATSSIALVGTTGQYSDLSGKPTIPSALSELSGDSTHRTVTDTEKSTWNSKQAAFGYTAENSANKGTANGYPSLDSGGKVPSAQIPTLNQNTTGTAAGLTAQYIDWSLTSGGASIKNKPTLSTVATSGNYSDLNGKPAPYTLPTASTIVKGGVLIDGSSIQIDGSGVIHSTVSAGVSSVNGYTGDIDLQTTDIVGFGSYSSSVNSRLAGKMDNVNPIFSGTLDNTNADNTHFSNDYNTTSCPSGVAEGTKCTLPSGIWWYKNGDWTQAGLLPAYTLPPATASVIGGVKPGTALSVDGNGVISVMLNSLGPSGLVTAGLAGDQTISSGFAYVATATPWKATFNSYTSTKQTTVFANYSGTVCAASGSKLYWPNPVTFVNNSSVCAKLRTGTRATVQMLGGKTYATATQNLQHASLPAASVSPTSLAFGSVATGSTSALTATLTNAGLANLITGSPSITGTDAAKFSISSNGCNAATVTPGATCVEGITFTPGATAGGPYSAQISIPHNAGGSPTVLALSGSGVNYTSSDTFDGTDGTALTTHNSNWASLPSPYLVGGLSLSGNAVQTTSTYTVAGAYMSTSTSDVSQITFKGLTNTAQSVSKYVAVRAGAATLGYSATLALSGGNWTTLTIRKNSATLGTACAGLSYAAGTDRTVKITASGTSTVTVTAYIDGTQVCQATDSSSPIPPGSPGFYVTGNGTLGNNRFDDWSAQ